MILVYSLSYCWLRIVSYFLCVLLSVLGNVSEPSDGHAAVPG